MPSIRVMFPNGVSRSSVALGLLLTLLAFPMSAAADAGWERVEDMPTSRETQGAAVSGGRWFVGGGMSGTAATLTFPNSVDVFDPVTGHWQTMAPIKTARSYLPAATDPTSGNVLFVGGTPPSEFGNIPSGEADFGDGASWSISQLITARFGHGLAYAAGRFVVCGGWTPSVQLDSAEMLDPTQGTWVPAGTMPGGARSDPTMTPLSDGRRILVAGGSRPDGALSSVDIFDVASGTWSRAADMGTARVRHRAVLLQDGRVLVAGSVAPLPRLPVVSSAEIYDPAKDMWTPAASMQQGRWGHAMERLPDGRVIVAGGTSSLSTEPGALDSVELYDPKSDTWTTAPSLNDPRVYLSMAVLSDGVYVTGGENNTSGNPLNGAISLASTERLAFSVLAINVDAGIEDGAGGQDGEAEAGVDAVAESGTPSSPASGSSGCSCRIGRARRPRAPLSLVALVAVAMLLRRRVPVKDRKQSRRYAIDHLPRHQ